MIRARLLTAADDVRLARRSERGDPAAKDELGTATPRLIYVFPRRCRDRGVPLEDLVQEGSVGLLGVNWTRCVPRPADCIGAVEGGRADPVTPHRVCSTRGAT